MNYGKLALALAFTASAAFASDHLTQIAGYAKDLHADFAAMAQTLKKKDFAAGELQRDLETLREHVEKLKGIASEFEAANPALDPAYHKEWQNTKELILLVDIFHGQKADLLRGDNPSKNRKLLRAKAEGLAKRSTALRESAMRLARNMRT